MDALELSFACLGPPNAAKAPLLVCAEAAKPAGGSLNSLGDIRGYRGSKQAFSTIIPQAPGMLKHLIFGPISASSGACS